MYIQNSSILQMVFIYLFIYLLCSALLQQSVWHNWYWGHISYGFKPFLPVFIYFMLMKSVFPCLCLLYMNCISIGNKAYVIVIVIVILLLFVGVIGIWFLTVSILQNSMYTNVWHSSTHNFMTAIRGIFLLWKMSTLETTEIHRVSLNVDSTSPIIIYIRIISASHTSVILVFLW